MSRLVKFLKKESKRILALLLVVTLVFSANVFHAAKLVYASVTESSESLEDSAKEESTIKVNEEEKNGEGLIENSSEEKEAKENEEKLFAEKNTEDNGEDKAGIEEPEEEKEEDADASLVEEPEEDEEEDKTTKEDKSLSDGGSENDDTSLDDGKNKTIDKKDDSFDGDDSSDGDDLSDEASNSDEENKILNKDNDSSNGDDKASEDEKEEDIATASEINETELEDALKELKEALKNATASEIDIEENKTMPLFGGLGIVVYMPAWDLQGCSWGGDGGFGYVSGSKVYPYSLSSGNLLPGGVTPPVGKRFLGWRVHMSATLQLTENGKQYQDWLWYDSPVPLAPGTSLNFNPNISYGSTKQADDVTDKVLTISAWLEDIPTYTITLDSGPGNTTSAIYAQAGKYLTASSGGTEITTFGDPGLQSSYDGQYTFQGWYTSRNGDYSPAGDQKFDATGAKVGDSSWVTANTTLYACWSKRVYTVTLDKEGGTGGTDYIYVWYNNGKYQESAATNVLPSITVPTKSGYVFDGYKDSTRTDLYINADGSYNTSVFTNTKIGSNTTLYAQWIPKYKITLNVNGGSSTTPNVIWVKNGVGLYTNEDCTTVWNGSITKPTKEGYTFGGFGGNTDGSGTEYITSSGGRNTTNFTENSFSADKTIYAKWTPNVYHIALSQDGGTGGTNDLWVKYNTGIYSDSTCGTPIGSTIAVPTNVNYLFAGYYDTTLTTKYVDASGALTSSFTKTAWKGDPATVINMIAKWVPVYKITLDNNGGAGVAPSELFITGGNGTITAGVYTNVTCTTAYTSAALTKPTKAQNTFKGFNSEADGTGTDYIDKDGNATASFNVSAFTADTTIYAKWDPAIYKITFNNSGAATSGTEALWVKYGVGIYTNESCTTLYADPISKPTKTGYTFKGYNGWDKRGYKVKFVDENGALTTEFTNTAFTADAEIYVIWENNIYTIDLNNDGATIAGTANLYVKYADGIYNTSSCSGTRLVAIPTKPAKTHYVFGGYYADNTWAKKYIDAAGHFTSNFTNTTWNTSDTTTHITMVAKWIPVHEITLDNNGGAGVAPTSVWLEEGVGIFKEETCENRFTALTTLPTRPNYGFQGFVASADGTGDTYINADGTKNAAFDSVTWKSAQTIYAKWGPAVYKITLDNDGATTAGTAEVYEKYNDGIYANVDCTGGVITSITVPTKTNYIFDGYYADNTWAKKYIDANGNFTSNFTSTAFTSADSIKAKWIPVYKISFNKNNTDAGSTDVAPAEVYVEKGVGIYTTVDCTTDWAGPITKPTRAGYTFKGLVANDDGTGTKYVNEDGSIDTSTFNKDAFTGDTEIYANWENNIYTVDLNNNSATTAGTTNLYVKYNDGIYDTSACTGTSLSAIPTKPAKTHYVFGGYYADTTWAKEYIDADGNFTADFTSTTWNTDDTTTHITMVAKWIPVHEITLDVNNTDAGSTAVAPTSVWLEEGVGIFKEETCENRFTALTTKPTRPNYGFQGFVASADGTGDTYINADGTKNAAFDSVTWKSAQTIYAKWGPAIYKITLDNDGATTAGTAEVYEKYNDGIYANVDCTGGVITSITVPTKTNYIFDGYYADNTWAKKYIDANGNFTSNFTSTAFTQADSIKAKWIPVYKISFNKNNTDAGSTDVAPAEVYVEKGVGIFTTVDCTTDWAGPITKPTRAGYTFKGLVANDDGTGTKYVNEDGSIDTSTFNKDAFTADTEIYANWENNIYTVDLNNDSATTPGTANLYVKYNDGIYDTSACTGTSLSAIPTKPAKTHYVFGGYYADTTWAKKYIDADGNFTADFTSTTWNTDDTTTHITMVAKWVPVHKITLNKNNTDTGSTEADPQVIWIAEGLGIFTTEECTTTFLSLTTKPKRTNYGFQGFVANAASDGSGTEYIKDTGEINSTNLNGSTFTVDTEIYAKWGPAIYRIELDNDGADAGSEGTLEVYEKYNYGIYTDSSCGTTISNITVPVKTGSTFKGYFDEATLSIEYIDNAGNITFTNTTFEEATKIKAKWEVNVYKINLDDDTPTTPGMGNLYVKYNDGVYTNQACTGAKVTTVTKPTKTGNVFDGYYDVATGTIQYIDKDGNYTSEFTTTTWTGNPTVAIDMKAKWIPVHRVALNNNGGDTMVVPSEVWLKEGVGIFTTADCTTEFTSLTTKPTRVNYSFKGFVQGIDGSGDTYINADGTKNIAFDLVTWTADTEIFAKWGPAIYKVELNNDGADTAGTLEVFEKYADNIYAEGGCTNVVTSITVPTKANYTFDGYYDETSLTTQYINADGTINTTNFTTTTFTNDVRIKAKWSPKVYTITLDDGGADTPGTTAIYEKYGVGFYSDPACTSVITRVTKPANATSVCKGYFESTGGAGTRYIKEDGSIDTGVLTNTTITDDSKILYAAYIDISNVYTIILDKVGGDGGVSILYKQNEGSVYTDNKCINLATRISVPSKSKKYFDGYYTGSSGAGTICVNSNGYVVMGAFPNSAMTIYACWKNSSGKIDSGGGSSGGSGGSGGTIPITNKDGIIVRPSPYLESDIVIHWDNDTLQKDYTIIKDKSTNKYKYSVDGAPVLNKWVGEPGLDNKTNWHYVDGNNEVTKGWKVINGSWYCFDNNGLMYTGSHVIDGQTYYFSEAQNQDEGKLITDISYEKTNMNIIMAPEKTNEAFNLINKIVSWVKGIGKDDTVNISYNKKDNKYYYADGKQVANKWIGENDATGKTMWRYASNDSELWKGWLIINDDWYFFDNNGVMLTGYQLINGIPFYFNEIGADEGKLYKGVQV